MAAIVRCSLGVAMIAKQSRSDREETYEKSVAYAKVHELCLNRVAIINQILGCRHDYMHGNPCNIYIHGSTHTVELFGNRITSWKRWDLEGCKRAFQDLDFAQEIIWNGKRLGYVNTMDTNS